MGMNSTLDFSIAQPKPDALLRLLCFPHAGGAPAAFFPWIALLAPEIECVCVQYPGRGQRFREEPLTSIPDLVSKILPRMADITDKPFAFYGHSLGGWVAFELARALRRVGLPAPEHLFLGASRSPHLGPLLPTIHELPEEAFVAAIQTRYGGIPRVIYEDREVLRLFVGAMRADFTAFELYRISPEAPLEIPMTAFAATEDDAVTPSSMQEWARHTTAEFELKRVPGGHFFSPDSIRLVVDVVRERVLARMAAREDATACR